MPIYTLENVYKTYKTYKIKTHALENINLKLQEGEIVVILGPSGSGKSTLLNILSGIDNPSKGKVFFYNKQINNLNQKQLTIYRKKYIGFIFQSYNLIPNITAKENIELGENLSEDPLDIKSIIKTVGLEKEQNKYPYQLSGGQMQRVAISRALIKNPKILFCDEPTGALDEKTGKIVLQTLQKINKEYNTTIIIVTHNPSLAQMANTIIKIKNGQIEEVITNKNIKDANELRWA